MFSMSATAPNSARKNKRHQRRGATKDSSPGTSSVRGGEDSIKQTSTISGGDSFASPSKTKVSKKLTRSQNNSSPNTHQNSLGDTTIQSGASSPLPPPVPRRSVADTKSNHMISGGASNNNPDDYRDEESNGQRSSAHILGNVQNNSNNTTATNDDQHDVQSTAKIMDAPNDSPILPKPSRVMMHRNDSLSAYINDVDLLPNNYQRHHLSPKQDRCSPEMKKNILSLLEKGGQKQQQQKEEGNVEFESVKNSPQLHHPNDQGQHEYDEMTLSDTNSTSHHQDLELCRKRLETEESKASTLSGNDLLNLQQGCTLSCGGSSGNVDTMNEVVVDKERFTRSCSLEPMVDDVVEDEERLGIVKGGASISHENNDVKSKSPPPPPTSSSLEHQQQPKPSSPSIYRLYNNSPTSPMSEVHSTLMGEASKAAAFERSPCSSTGVTPSLFQENADDDIGGDTYFEGKLSPRLQPSSFSSLAGNERRVINDDEKGAVDDFITPLPPPKVNRTKNNPMRCSSSSSNDPTASPAAASSNTTTTSIDQLAGAPSLPIQSPRRQTFTPHTHSLLDDCSDEEENDDDDDEELSSSYVMVDTKSLSRSISARKRGSSHRSSGSISISQQMANNNIQLALLQTRHRRWEIQSAFCGSHAQSNQVFDLSNRVHHIPKFHNRHQQHFSFSPIRPSTTSDADIDDDGVAFLARLSVPIESVRAGALGSGLWRTVRLVKLPKGLFGWHWLMWKEQRQVPDSVYFGDNMPLDNEVWSLLQMLGETFPNLEQVDFGGDIAKTPATTSREDHSVDSADTYNNEEWRNEILTCVMQCLPHLVAVDGFAVEMERGDDEDGPIKSNETQESSLDESFGDVPLNANDERQSGQAARDGQVHTGVRTRKVRCRTSSFTIPNQCDVATETSDAIEDVSENMMSLCTDYLSPHAHSEEKSIPTDQYGPMIESIASEDETKVVHSASSPLASSFSWGSAGSSGARPPPCPQSDSRRRLPSKPTIKSQMKSKLSKKNKRRLKKLTGMIPSMMDDEEDSDENGSIEGDGAEECPADLL